MFQLVDKTLPALLSFEAVCYGHQFEDLFPNNDVIKCGLLRVWCMRDPVSIYVSRTVRLLTCYPVYECVAVWGCGPLVWVWECNSVGLLYALVWVWECNSVGLLRALVWVWESSGVGLLRALVARLQWGVSGQFCSECGSISNRRVAIHQHLGAEPACM